MKSVSNIDIHSHEQRNFLVLLIALVIHYTVRFQFEYDSVASIHFGLGGQIHPPYDDQDVWDQFPFVVRMIISTCRHSFRRFFFLPPRRNKNEYSCLSSVHKKSLIGC